MILKGNYFSNDFRYIEINFKLCAGKPICASDQKIRDWLYPNNPLMQVMMTKTLIDIDKIEIKKPVQVFVDDRTYLGLNTVSQQILNIFVGKASLHINKSWWNIGTLQYDYHKINEVRLQHQSFQFPIPPGGDDRLAKIYLRLDDMNETMNVKLYSLLDLFSEVGGIGAFMFSFFGFLAWILLYDFLVAELVQKLYRRV